jgi:ABC-type transporter Mla subunit MlaD
VEIKISKKNLIAIGVVLALCVSCFLAGRFIRVGRVTGTSEQLVDGIVLSRDTANSILNRLNIATTTLKSSADYEHAIVGGFEKLQRTTEIGQLCITELERTIESSKEFTKMLNDNYSEFSSNTDRAFDMAIRKSEEYERLIESLQQFANHIDEDNKESE